MKKQLSKLLLVVFLIQISLLTSAKSISEMMLDAVNYVDIPGMSVMYMSGPSEDENFYTFKVGSDGKDVFACSEWIYIYVEPVYRVYKMDIVSDRIILLHEGGKINGDIVKDVEYLEIYKFAERENSTYGNRYYIPQKRAE